MIFTLCLVLHSAVLTWRSRRRWRSLSSFSKRWSTHTPTFDLIISQALIVHYFGFHRYNCFIAPRITQAYLKSSSHAQVCDLLIRRTCWVTILSELKYRSPSQDCFLCIGRRQPCKTNWEFISNIPITGLDLPGVDGFIFLLATFADVTKVIRTYTKWLWVTFHLRPSTTLVKWTSL